jgi:hypothetical protein
MENNDQSKFLDFIFNEKNFKFENRIYRKKNSLKDLNFLDNLPKCDINENRLSIATKIDHNSNMFKEIITFLQFKDFLNLKLVCKKFKSEIDSSLFKKYIKKIGVNKEIENIKEFIWGKVLNINE